jgi:hypothetical protein
MLFLSHQFYYYSPICVYSSKWSRPFRFSTQNFVCMFPLPHPSHHPQPDCPNSTGQGVQITKLLIMKFSVVPSPPLSLSGPKTPTPLQVFQLGFCMYFWSLQCMQHVTPMSSSFRILRPSSVNNLYILLYYASFPHIRPLRGNVKHFLNTLIYITPVMMA